ncbi:MAG: radical SAM protein [Desulfobulbaceae bacterium]|nr:MAG: radical SAM protein [Desulfobulbaceae bacterium]
MKFIFGPVNSRRLGISLGIDLLPPKTCNFNCIYCEVGPTTDFATERGEYTDTAAIIDEIDVFGANQAAVSRLDILTITASGEPTLHAGLGRIIEHLKKNIAKPVAVLTNGSLLHLAEVRRELAAADIVIPSLDAAREASFRKINRPTAACRLEQVITGLADFCRDFNGRCWLEVLLARGINDRPEDLAALVAAAQRIKPERIQLNTVVRPPIEAYALPLTLDEMRAAAAIFPGPVDILTDYTPGTSTAVVAEPLTATKGQLKDIERRREAVLHLLQRRPCTATDVSVALGLPSQEVAAALEHLRELGRIEPSSHRDKEYFIVLPQRQEPLPDKNL